MSLTERVDAAIKYFDEEGFHWDEIPNWATGTRWRLPKLVELGAPEFIIENEIEILKKRVRWMKEERLGVVLQ